MCQALATLAATLILAAPAAAAGPAPPLGNDGRSIPAGPARVAFINAVTMAYRRPPYPPKAAGFGADDARFLRMHGFNGVRLGVIYKGVEPSPGRYDDGYIRHVA